MPQQKQFVATPTVPPNQDLYLNRELGVLAFNERVLAMAADPVVPLLERLRYLCIVSSNLDEFFEIRVASLAQKIIHNPHALEKCGTSVQAIMAAVSECVHVMVAKQYALLNDNILPKLRHTGIGLLSTDLWSTSVTQWAHHYFTEQVLPVLTPIGLDPAHPFPRVLNKALNFAVAIAGEDDFGRRSNMAIVQAPRALPRLIRVPKAHTDFDFAVVTLTSLMQAFIPELFPGVQVHGVVQFRVTRNSDLFLDEEGAMTNLRVALQGELSQRHFGDAVRLEVSETCSDAIAQHLLREFGLPLYALYRVNGPVNLVRLNKICDWVDRPDLKFPAFVPNTPSAVLHSSDYFKLLDDGDVLLHHPYDSFRPVLEFVRQSALCPHVVAIKQTIYRTGMDSELMESLLMAARSGKEVTVVLELRARFDEEANIQWAARLEQVGAHVVYGVVGQKTHAKMLMVVRRTPNSTDQVLKRYVHVGTGNYHPTTAALYTDFGLFTSNPQIGQDIHELFNQLTGFGKVQALGLLWHAPFHFHGHLVDAIRNETIAARQGQAAHIMVRVNALLEPVLINELYLASQAGVRIDLIVRGVCALRPGVPGLSENIHVRSVVGRFLEHSRVFYFYAGGCENVYISSADWMTRNCFRRVELAVPILDAKLKKKVIREGLVALLKERVLAWEMNFNGTYQRMSKTGYRADNVHARLLQHRR